VVLVVGVNGSGKTTTCGKLAWRLRQEGREVMLAAGDTFRAAATEQLERWGERAGVPVVSQGSGADPSAVAFDAVKAAQARGSEILIVDTAGRLHTKTNLMAELAKVKRVIGRRAWGRRTRFSSSWTRPPARTASPRPGSSTRASGSPASC
jgi:fused signal recognition particle receptor